MSHSSIAPAFMHASSLSVCLSVWPVCPLPPPCPSPLPQPADCRRADLRRAVQRPPACGGRGARLLLRRSRARPRQPARPHCRPRHGMCWCVVMVACGVWLIVLQSSHQLGLSVPPTGSHYRHHGPLQLFDLSGYWRVCDVSPPTSDCSNHKVPAVTNGSSGSRSGDGDNDDDDESGPLNSKCLRVGCCCSCCCCCWGGGEGEE